MPPEPTVETLRREWDDRARSPYRNFFVASHRGWRDPARWANQAETDVAHLLTAVDGDIPRGIGPVRYEDLDVLEIGCGVGRLAEVLSRSVRGYVGVDISKVMIEEARGRKIPKCRFLVCDGKTVPTEIEPARFGLVFALAVFIHCPRSVCLSFAKEARRLIAPRGQFRAQFLCDPSDPEGLVEVRGGPPPATAPNPQEEFEDEVDVGAAKYLDGTAYTGYMFRVSELREMLLGAGFSRVAVGRFSLEHVSAVAWA